MNKAILINAALCLAIDGIKRVLAKLKTNPSPQ